MKTFRTFGVLSAFVAFGFPSLESVAAETGTPQPATTAAVAQPAPPPKILIKTNYGKIEAELNREKARVTVANFLAYVEKKHYDSTLFHRVIPGFMIQGGGMTKDMKEKTTEFPPIKNEAGNGLKNDVGTLAMARTGIVDSATAQFFINVKDNEFLNHRDTTDRGYGYAVFGKVTKGMDVVRKIEKVATTSQRGHENVPAKPVIIESVREIK